jgi:hypothetical protein
MHFHLPKPLHGWRAFAGEVGIIVVGVLIALAAEQVVEEWRWDRKADAAQSAIMQELALDAGVYDERAIMAKCLEGKGQQLSDLLRLAHRTGTLPNIEYINGPATRPVVTAAWTAAIADGTLPHLPENFRKMLGVEYPLIADYPHNLDGENQLWSVVRLADRAPGPISETLLAQISTALARARFESYMNDLIAEQSLEMIEKAGVKPNYSFALDDGASRADLLKATPCQPLVVNGKPLPLPDTTSATARPSVKG